MESPNKWWYALAKCRTLTRKESDELFFVTTGSRAREGKEFCQGCPVIQECLQYAVVYKESGVWGGTNDSDRRRISPMLYLQFKKNLESQGPLESRNIQDFIPKQQLPQDVVDEVIDIIDLSQYDILLLDILGDVSGF